MLFSLINFFCLVVFRFVMCCLCFHYFCVCLLNEIGNKIGVENTSHYGNLPVRSFMYSPEHQHHNNSSMMMGGGANNGGIPDLGTLRWVVHPLNCKRHLLHIYTIIIYPLLHLTEECLPGCLTMETMVEWKVFRRHPLAIIVLHICQ